MFLCFASALRVKSFLIYVTLNQVTKNKKDITNAKNSTQFRAITARTATPNIRIKPRTSWCGTHSTTIAILLYC